MQIQGSRTSRYTRDATERNRLPARRGHHHQHQYQGHRSSRELEMLAARGNPTAIAHSSKTSPVCSCCCSLQPLNAKHTTTRCRREAVACSYTQPTPSTLPAAHPASRCHTAAAAILPVAAISNTPGTPQPQRPPPRLQGSYRPAVLSQINCCSHAGGRNRPARAPYAPIPSPSPLLSSAPSPLYTASIWHPCLLAAARSVNQPTPCPDSLPASPREWEHLPFLSVGESQLQASLLTCAF